MAIEMDIFGGYACRDIIRHDEKGHYQVERCISGVPITTLYGPSPVISKEKLASSSLSVYEQRMLEVQGSGKAVGLLKRSKANVLLIDLTDELLRRFWVAGEKKDFQLATEEKYAQDIENMFVDAKTVVTRQSPLDMKLPEVEESFKRFAKEITFSEENPGGYKEKNIIVVEAYYTEKIIDNATAKVKDHPKGAEIKKSNEFLRQLYLMLYRYIPGCNSIKFPEYTHASENHLRGATPLSYSEETYLYYLRVLNVLFGFDKVNSVNNIHSEQNLSNKLYTRMLNASTIYSIDGMKKDIETLKSDFKKQIEEIKKQGVSSALGLGEEAKKVLAEEKKKSAELQKQLEKEKAQNEETKKQLEKDKKLIEEAKKDLEESKKQFEKTKEQVEETKKQTEESRKQAEETKKQNEEIKKQNEEIRKLNEEIKKQTVEAKEQTEAIQKQNEISKKQLDEEKKKLADRMRQFEEDKELIDRSNKQAAEFRQQHERFKRQHEVMKQQEEEIKQLHEELQKIKDLRKVQGQEGHSELVDEKARLERELKDAKKKLIEMAEQGGSSRIHEENERITKEYKRTKEELEKAMEANRTLNVENKYLVGVREELNRENTRLSKLVQKILLTGADKNSL